MENADLTNAKIFGVDFTSTKINGANMNNVDKTKIMIFMKKSDIEMLQKYSNLLEEDFSNSNINNMDISESKFQNIDFSNSDLSNNKMAHVDFEGSDLSMQI